MRSRWRGLRAISSPHLRPVLMAVSIMSRCWTGRAVRMATYSVGVSVRVFFLTTLGSSVWAQGLKVTTRSRRARSKTECSMVWYFRTLAAHRPFSVAVVTQRWISEGRILPIGRFPKVGVKGLSRVERYAARVEGSACLGGGQTVSREGGEGAWR